MSEKLRILVLADFDPCGVCLGHRDALRLFCGDSFDMRVALHHAYSDRHRDADWVYKPLEGRIAETGAFVFGTPTGDIDELIHFAREAHIIQVCPGIGQPWGNFALLAPTDGHDAPDDNYFDRPWREIVERVKARVAYFHGSVNTWAHRAEYTKRYHTYIAATSTLDYACELPAAYLPPVVPVVSGLAKLRGDDDPLIVAHTPTNTSICHTDLFLRLCRELGIVANYKTEVMHEVVLAAKKASFAGFDHLRGSFSVNSLENCATGIANLVGLKGAYRQRLVREGFDNMPGFALENKDDLRRALITLRDNPGLNRDQQHACLNWVDRNFGVPRIAERMANFYQDVAEG